MQKVDFQLQALVSMVQLEVKFKPKWPNVDEEDFLEHKTCINFLTFDLNST